MPAHSSTARTGPPAMTPVPGRAGLQQHDAGRLLALDGVRDRALDAGDLEEVLLGLLDALGDRRRHLLGLAVADADGAVAVAHHDERGEAEAAAALDDLGHAVDRDDALDVRGLLGRAASARRRDGRGGSLPPAARHRGAGVQASDVLFSLLIMLLQFVSCVIRSPAPPRGRRRRARRPDRGSVLPPRSNTTASTPASLARSATSSPTLRALAVLSPSSARRSASIVEAEASVRPATSSTTWTNTCRAERRHDQARTGRRTGDLLAHADVATLARQHPATGLGAAQLDTDSHGLLTSLSDLAADDLAGVTHALALVRVGLAELADVGGDLADLLLVDARDDEAGRATRRRSVMPSGACTTTGWLKPSANSRSEPLAGTR